MELINDTKLKAVFTSKQVMTENALITHVFYDEDGDWLFFHAETIKEQDAFILSAEQILKQDKTLESLPDMQPGEKVRRTGADENWQKY